MADLPTVLPAPRTPALRGGPVLRWGVMAPGTIARDWVEAVRGRTDQIVAAVASRSLDRAQAFAAAYGVDAAYGSYDAMLADPAIDVVYIAAPHSEHEELATRSIRAGKHVLVEKPIATSAAGARRLRAEARATGVFVMEALWTRFLPQTDVIRQLLDDGVLGEPMSVTADIGGRADPAANPRLFDPALGGGALLDTGVYPVWLAHFVLGAPSSVTARGILAASGVDVQASLLLDYAGAAQASLATSLVADTPIVATIAGTAARIELARPFISAPSFELVSRSGRLRWDEQPGSGGRAGLCHEVVAVATAIDAGLREAPGHTLDDSIAVLEVIDAARSFIRRPA